MFRHDVTPQSATYLPLGRMKSQNRELLDELLNHLIVMRIVVGVLGAVVVGLFSRWLHFLHRAWATIPLPVHQECGQAMTDDDEPTNVAGIVGFVLSILSILTLGCLAPVALVISVAGLQESRRNGLAIAGTTISAVAMIPFVIIFGPFVLAAIAFLVTPK